MNTTLLGLRPTCDADRHFCYAVKKAALRAYVEPIWGWDEQEQIDFHHNDWNQQRPEIITHDGRDIGTIEIVRSETELHLGEFYLFPEYQKQGIGSHFLERLVQEADAKKLPTRLEVIKINPVKSLYLRFGFQDTGETKTHYLMERSPRQAVLPHQAPST
ncbi:hypothetical protein Rhal01_02562 [Rubritalea halochordaticola]|uniref:N-acetyltransferase domain-containing protein n=1 Tax=Rubritalea halochordaticola TaxID=714537 RepID=A0ABP9V108_9BACT